MSVRVRLALATLMCAGAVLILASHSGAHQATAASSPAPAPATATQVSSKAQAAAAAYPASLSRAAAAAAASQTAADAQGHTLFEERCASCHGALAQGRPEMGPALRGVGAGPVLFYLSTGRMPLENPDEEPERSPPSFGPAQIGAIASWIATFGGPPAPTADPGQGNLAEGLSLFTENCAGCHQVVARGGLTLGARVPGLTGVTPEQIAEAVRTGPYLMPVFGPQQIDQQQLDSIARYVEWARHPDNPGGWAINNIGPIPEGMVAWLLGLGALVIVARVIGQRVSDGGEPRP